MGLIVMLNVRIGEGAVVGAASLVTKDVPPFTIVAGVGAKFLRKIDIPKDPPAPAVDLKGW